MAIEPDNDKLMQAREELLAAAHRVMEGRIDDRPQGPNDGLGEAAKRYAALATEPRGAMQIVVKHCRHSGPGPGVGASVPGEVTVQVVHEQEAGGEQAQEPIAVSLGQRVTLAVGCSENEHPGGGIESCTPAVTDTQVQAAIDGPGIQTSQGGE